jgi:taurine dioxygenase
MATLHLEKLTAGIGAIATGAGLRDGIADPATAAAIRAALWEHLVLVFPAQDLDDETHVAAAGIFGEPFLTPYGKALGMTNPIDVIADDPEKLPDRDGWHTDAPFLVEPPAVALLRAVTVPEAGGDTLFSDMYAAHDAMSDTMRAMLADARVSYPLQKGLLVYVEERAGKEIADLVRDNAGPGGLHPILRTHPETGRKALYYADGFADGIDGLSAAENEAFRPYLASLPLDPSRQCRWRWHEGDVVIWDERSTQHFGAADHAGGVREMRRVMVTGEVPR